VNASIANLEEKNITTGNTGETLGIQWLITQGRSECEHSEPGRKKHYHGEHGLKLPGDRVKNG